MPKENFETPEDFFEFQECLRRTSANTFTTELVRRIRFDGIGREEIPLTDPELKIKYYAVYKKESREKAEPFLAFARRLNGLMFPEVDAEN